VSEDEPVDFEVPFVKFKKLCCPFCKSEDRQRIYGHSPKGFVYVRCGFCIRPYNERKAAGQLDLVGQQTAYKYKAKAE